RAGRRGPSSPQTGHPVPPPQPDPGRADCEYRGDPQLRGRDRVRPDAPELVAPFADTARVVPLVHAEPEVPRIRREQEFGEEPLGHEENGQEREPPERG